MIKTKIKTRATKAEREPSEGGIYMSFVSVFENCICYKNGHVSNVAVWFFLN